MGRQVPWDEIPSAGALVPDGVYVLEVTGLEESQSQSGKLMYPGVFAVVEPVDFAGYPVYENYVIGNDDDPNADDPATWKKSMGSRFMRTMLDKAGVPLDGDMDAVSAEAAGRQFLAVIGQRETDRGTMVNQIRSYYALGEREVGVSSGATPTTRPGPKPAPRAAPQAAAPRPAPRPAPKPAATPAPARAASAGARPAAAPATRAPAVKMLTCTICKKPVPRDEFADHVETCEGGEE